MHLKTALESWSCCSILFYFSAVRQKEVFFKLNPSHTLAVLECKTDHLCVNQALLVLMMPHLYCYCASVDVCVAVCVCCSLSLCQNRLFVCFFPGSVWSCLWVCSCLCVCSLSVNSVLTSRRVDPLTVIPLPNLRGVSGGARSARC